MSTLELLKQQTIGIEDAYDVDMSETSKGGGGGRLLPAGYAMARLVEYIELGKQIETYQGKPKAPALQFRLGFALWGDTEPFDATGQPNPVAPEARPHTLFHNPDGTPSFLRTWNMSLSNNEKAKAKLIFDKMNFKGQAKHYAQFLGEPFLVKVCIKPAEGEKKARNYLELKDTLPPFDQVSRQPYPVPQAPDDAYTLFLWNRPTLEGWNALKIEGTNDKGESKNYLQDTILKAVDFVGSPLEQLLRGAGAVLPTPEQLQGATAASEAPPAPVQAAPATPVAPAASLPSVPAAAPSLALPNSPLPAAGSSTTPTGGTINSAPAAIPTLPIPPVA